jgi:hypothetical protein
MAWYPDPKQRFPMTQDDQKANNSAHFPETLWGGGDMVFTFEVSIMNSDAEGGLLKRDLEALADPDEGEVLEHFNPCSDNGILYEGTPFSFTANSMEYADKIVQFFRNSTYWQVESVHISWEWDYN